MWQPALIRSPIQQHNIFIGDYIMALHTVEIKEAESPYFSSRHTCRVKFIQQYAFRCEVVDRKSYVLAHHFSSEKEMMLNIVREDFISSVKTRLVSDAIEMINQGLVVSGFAVHTTGSEKFYAVDSFDSHHMSLIVDKLKLQSDLNNSHHHPEF
jgi:hypothetical protein